MEKPTHNFFTINDTYQKLNALENACSEALEKKQILIPEEPSRGSIAILAPQFHPPAKGLSYPEGKARLLHDLASIEMQAMELALRTLYEFPEAPEEFREALYKLTISEGKHCEACISALSDLGFEWGFRPVHLQLWSAVSAEDDLLDRILIVHRYLEGSGLDAGEAIIKRLAGIGSTDASSVKAMSVLKYIQSEELDHVYFGSHWYRKICEQMGLNPETDFKERLNKLKTRLPKRLEKINHRLRLQAGFTPVELEIVEQYRSKLF